MQTRAITFDLWDTLFIDGSDEKKRADSGLPSKKKAREQLFFEFVKKSTDMSEREAKTVFKTIESAFNHTWKNHSITWSVAERVQIAIDALKISPSEKDCSDIIMALERMELSPMPKLLPGARETLRELADEYKLGIISDTIYSSGKTLREMLTRENIIDCFSSFVFSDELGHSKPHRATFEKSIENLRCQPGELIHIGDRIPNDIEGARAFGARAILCKAAIERDGAYKSHDGSFRHYQELPSLIKSCSEVST